MRPEVGWWWYFVAKVASVLGTNGTVSTSAACPVCVQANLSEMEGGSSLQLSFNNTRAV